MAVALGTAGFERSTSSTSSSTHRREPQALGGGLLLCSGVDRMQPPAVWDQWRPMRSGWCHRRRLCVRARCRTWWFFYCVKDEYVFFCCGESQSDTRANRIRDTTSNFSHTAGSTTAFSGAVPNRIRGFWGAPSRKTRGRASGSCDTGCTARAVP